MNTEVLSTGTVRSLSQRARAFYALTKPRVVSLIVFTAMIGMLLATPGMVPPRVLLAGTLGIALVAGAAAAVNCLVEQRIDALMLRTRWRPLPRGELGALQTLMFAGLMVVQLPLLLTPGPGSPRSSSRTSSHTSDRWCNSKTAS